DSQAWQEIFTYGKWIFFSTIITFLANEVDRILLGKLLSIELLGIYGIALMMKRAGEQGIRKLGSQIMFPAFSEISRKDPTQLYKKVRHARVPMIGMMWIFCLILIFWGPLLIGVLYDSRYQAAGWMVQLLGAGAMIDVLGVSY